MLKNSRKKQKRPMLLLEILIALTLVALCAIPLISTHTGILKEQKAFTSKMELDHASHLLYVYFLEQLHTNKIAWSQIQNKTPQPIPEEYFKNAGQQKKLPYLGTYRFEEIKCKHDPRKEWNVCLINLIFTFIPEQGEKSKGIEFSYTIPLVKHILANGSQEEEEDQDKDKQKSTKQKKGNKKSKAESEPSEEEGSNES